MAEKSTLLAGAATIEITPLDYRETYLAGFRPDRKASGVLDPLFARALYLNDGETSLAIVGLDLIGLLYPVTKSIRAKVKDVPENNIFLCCTHTHSGPDTLGLWGPAVKEISYLSGVDRAYIKRLEKLVVHAIRKAKKRAVPAVLGFAEDGSNKDEITWNVRQPGLIDHTLSVMRVDRADGRGNIAVLTNYASHPEALWEMNSRISPDWPVAVHRTMERSMGGVSIFINGALGAMVTPGLEESAPLYKRESFYVSYGSKIARYALDAVRSVQFEKEPKISVRVLEEKFPLENDKLYFAAGMGLLERRLDKAGVITQVGVIRIGPAMIATVPGEVAPAVGMKLKANMKARKKMLFGLANDEIGYILEKAHFTDPLFGYETTVSMGPDTETALLRTFRQLAD